MSRWRRRRPHGAAAGLFDIAGNRPSLSLYRYGNDVRAWTYTEALGAFRQGVAKTGDDPSKVDLNSSRIGGATTLAAEGEVSPRAIQI